MLKEERNIRIEVVIAIVILALSIWLRLSLTEWCLILFCIGAVLASEAFNSSIERVANFLTMESNNQIRDIKDMAAAGVLIMAIVAVLIGVVILLPKILFRLQNF
jgi:diacylglycerol kinase